MPTKQHSAKVSAYTDPRMLESLGGVNRYAHAQGLTRKEPLKELRQELAYALYLPVCCQFPTSPVLVFNVGEQLVADLVEMQPLKKWN